MITALLIHNGPFHNVKAVFVITCLLLVSAIFFHFADTEMLEALLFPPNKRRLLSESTSPHFSKAGPDKGKKNCSITDVTGWQRGGSAALPSLTTLTDPYYVLCEHRLPRLSVRVH